MPLLGKTSVIARGVSCHTKCFFVETTLGHTERSVAQATQRTRSRSASISQAGDVLRAGLSSHLRSRSAMLVTLSWKYCTISEKRKLKALKLTCNPKKCQCTNRAGEWGPKNKRYRCR